MVDMIFYIEGKPKDIFGVGFRPAINGSASEIGLISAAINMPIRVQVLLSSSNNVISTFYNQIKQNDIRIKPTEKRSIAYVFA